MLKGVVTNFGDYYGFDNTYGFILGDDNREYFVHYSFIQGEGYKTLDIGQRVIFEAYETEKGWQAHNVRLEFEDNDIEDIDFILKTNPFNPQQPVIETFKFAGRKNIFRNAIDSLFNHKNILITGPRGIGKSSVATQLVYATEGERELIDRLGINLSGFEFNYLSADHRCFTQNTIQDIIYGLLSNLLKKLSRQKEKVTSTVSHEINLKFYKRRQETKTEPELEHTEIVNRFTSDIEQLWDTLVDFGYNGICFLIDEVDILQIDVPLANFLKSSIEKFRHDKFFDISFIVAGVTGTTDALFYEHKSSLRLFDSITLETMKDYELIEILENCLRETEIEIDYDAKNKIAKLAKGFPHPVQLIGYHSFRFDNDNLIDLSDVSSALSYIVFDEAKIKYKKMREKAIGKIGDDILHVMAASINEEVKLSYLLNRLDEEPKVIYPALANLVKYRLIYRITERLYTIRDPLFKIYLRWVYGFE